MPAPFGISLRQVTPGNLDEITALKVSPQQEHLIPSNERNLADAFVSGWPVTAFGIYDGEQAVGFIMFAYLNREPIQHWTDNSYFIWRFMIDARYQGQGFGRLGLQQAIAEIETLPAGKADWMWLCYDPTNQIASRLYESLGFIDAPLRAPTDTPWKRRRIS